MHSVNHKKERKAQTKMNKKRRWLVPVTAVLLLTVLITTVFATVISANDSTYYGDSPYISQNNDLYFDKSQYFDSSVVYRLPDSVSMNDELSLIIELPGYTVLDYYSKSGIMSLENGLYYICFRILND